MASRTGSGGITLTLSLSGTGQVIKTGSIDTALGILETSISGTLGSAGSIDAALGKLESNITGNVSIVGAINAELAGPESSITGGPEVSGNIDAALGILGAAVSGYLDITGSIDAALGSLAALIAGSTGDGSTWTVVVINLSNGAITEYSPFEFNSLIEWNGSYYGANDSGIYLLEGVNDDGSQIAGYITTGITDHGTGETKRVSDVYISGKFSAAVLTTLVDEGNVSNSHDVTGGSYFDSYKVNVGRGTRARYWQYKVANKNGGAFEMDSMDVIPNPVGRRKR